MALERVPAAEVRATERAKPVIVLEMHTGDVLAKARLLHGVAMIAVAPFADLMGLTLHVVARQVSGDAAGGEVVEDGITAARVPETAAVLDSLAPFVLHNARAEVLRATRESFVILELSLVSHDEVFLQGTVVVGEGETVLEHGRRPGRVTSTRGTPMALATAPHLHVMFEPSF